MYLDFNAAVFFSRMTHTGRALESDGQNKPSDKTHQKAIEKRKIIKKAQPLKKSRPNEEKVRTVRTFG
jgi:hypothetical protein